MLQSALVIVAMGGAVAQTYPDQLDILRGADTTPQIELVLDTSCSMGPMSPNLTSTCDWYFNNNISATPVAGNPMTRLELVKAVLTGCHGPTDGVLDQWANSVLFAIREFGVNDTNGSPRTDLRADFFGGPVDADGIPTGSDLANLEAAVSSLYPEGFTPMVRAYEQAARHFANDFDDTNSRSCRQNYIIMMTDGDGNYSQNTSNPAIFDFIPSQPSLTVSDAGGCYATGGCGSFQPPFGDEAARYLVRDSSDNVVDALPGVSDTVLPSGGTRGQPIRTYTISFDSPADSMALLTSMAINGEGLAYTASSYAQLDAAFTNIISSIVPRSQVAFTPGTLQTEGLYSGNYLYVPSFQPVENGHWFGTVKKHCVMPANNADATCLFMDDGSGDNLVTNTAVRDAWTGTTEQRATVGGTGQQIYSQLFTVSGPSSPVPSNPHSYRNIVTWRPGTTGYVAVDGSASFTTADTHTSNRCDHFRLINKLHGFTNQVEDCEAGDYDPVAFDSWVQGDTANGGTTLLKYSDECESPTSQCYVVTNANDGMLHVFRGRDGTELSAVIPGELWGSSPVAHNQLRDIMDQPTLSEMKRYYFDGGVRLFHVDGNANGFIDNSEKAYLVAGLGRGGRAYYLWDVSSFNGDFSSASAPAPRPLMVDEATGFRNLRDTWAAPWLGLFRDSSGTYRPVAAFASGHMRELDEVNSAFGNLEEALPATPTDSQSSPHTMSCSAFGLDTSLCTPPLPAGGCTACTNASGCGAPAGAVYCYDWPGYSGLPSAAPFDNGQPGGHDILFGPFSWSQPDQSAEAYQVVFNRFELQPGDRMEFLDQNQNLIGQLPAAGSPPPCSGAACSPWIYSPSFYVRLVSDGDDSVGVAGWEVDTVQTIRRINPPQGRSAGSFPPNPNVVPVTRPSVYFVDLDEWAALPEFGAMPTGSDTRQANPLLVRITSDCDGVATASEICVDASGSGGQAPQPDLAFMTCPISAELSVYQEGNVFRSAYVGDECGQIWKFDQDPAGAWTAQRILRLNNASAGGRVIPNRRSEDYRKIFTRLELVLSRCNGSRSIGVYFGTGNIQRAGSQSVLSDPSLVRVPGTGASIPGFSADGDVIGVVWDSPNLPRPPDGLSLADLENVTAITEITNPTAGNAQNGYFIELSLNGGKALRNPVVFDGVASFKVYQPLTPGTECISATGEDQVYQFDNCTAAPIVGNNTSDRLTWFGQTDIGGGLLVFTPPNGDTFVSTGDRQTSTDARLAGRPNQRAMRLYLWRNVEL